MKKFIKFQIQKKKKSNQNTIESNLILYLQHLTNLFIYFDFCCCYEQVSPDQGSGGARLLRGSRVQAERIPVRLQW